jgi:hypothetical protein
MYVNENTSDTSGPRSKGSVSSCSTGWILPIDPSLLSKEEESILNTLQR